MVDTQGDEDDPEYALTVGDKRQEKLKSSLEDAS